MHGDRSIDAVKCVTFKAKDDAGLSSLSREYFLVLRHEVPPKSADS